MSSPSYNLPTKFDVCHAFYWPLIRKTRTEIHALNPGMYYLRNVSKVVPLLPQKAKFLKLRFSSNKQQTNKQTSLWKCQVFLEGFLFGGQGHIPFPRKELASRPPKFTKGNSPYLSNPLSLLRIIAIILVPRASQCGRSQQPVLKYYVTLNLYQPQLLPSL